MFLPKTTLITFSFFLLASCTTNTSVGEKLPIIPIKPVSVVSTGEVIIATSSGSSNVLTGSSSIKTPEVATEVLSPDTQKLIDLQKNQGPNAISELNCAKYDVAGSKFCKAQQVLIKKFNDESITWEEVLKKGPDYIKSFNCMKIFSLDGQKECTTYQSTMIIKSSTK